MEQTTSVLCVVDDAVQRSSPFWGEHGLSLLVEKGGKRLLFDTGQSGTVLFRNLGLMDIDPKTIDAVAISHAHYDHTGGLPALSERVRPGLPLYANPDLFRARYSRKEGEVEEIGLGLTRGELGRHFALKLHAAPQEIFSGLWTTGEISQRPEAEGRSERHLMRKDEELVPDAYRDDMSLVLDLGDHLALLCGCCHAGLLNTLVHVERTYEQPIAVIAGGLHLTSATDDELQKVGRVLAAMPALRRVYPNHCSGEAAFVALTQALGAHIVRPCPVGTRLDLSAAALHRGAD